MDPCPYRRRWASAFCCARFRRLSLALRKKRKRSWKSTQSSLNSQPDTLPHSIHHSAWQLSALHDFIGHWPFKFAVVNGHSGSEGSWIYGESISFLQFHFHTLGCLVARIMHQVIGFVEIRNTSWLYMFWISWSRVNVCRDLQQIYRNKKRERREQNDQDFISEIYMSIIIFNYLEWNLMGVYKKIYLIITNE